MPILNKLTGAFPTALIYITAGTLLAVWTIVYWAFNAPATRTGYLWVVGFLMTGLSLLSIGLLLGRIGRAARTAELPPVEVSSAVVRTEIDAAHRVASPSAVSVGPINPTMADPITARAPIGEAPHTLLKSD